jgi:hypothetical protein
MHYFKAFIILIPVEQPTRPCLEVPPSDNFGEHRAAAPWSLTRTTGSGYLVSDTDDPRLAGCATELFPVRISVHHGQRLNVTVFDFGYGAAPGSNPSHVTGNGPPEAECDLFVVLSEPEVRRRVKVCPSSRRVRSGVYLSINRSVEIYFKRVGMAPSQQYQTDDRRLLVKYTGQSDLEIV